MADYFLARMHQQRNAYTGSMQRMATPLDPQAAYRDVADLAKALESHRSGEDFPLLDLPDDVLEHVAEKLPARSLAHLQASCQRVSKLLSQDRLWESAMQHADPVWYKAGILPIAGMHRGATWKELNATVAELQATGHIGGDVLVTPQRVCKKTLSLWNSGQMSARHQCQLNYRPSRTELISQIEVQLDYQLCHTEHKSSQWRKALGKHHFRAENITDLIELVYFLWFEARSLTRAAKMLAKVIVLLAEDKAQASSEASYWKLGYSSIQLGIQAACVGLYLVDLLHLAHLRCSPMYIEDPEDFLNTCQGTGQASEPILMVPLTPVNSSITNASNVNSNNTSSSCTNRDISHSQASSSNHHTSSSNTSSSSSTSNNPSSSDTINSSSSNTISSNTISSNTSSSSNSSSMFEWCSGKYSWQDLEDACSVLCVPGFKAQIQATRHLWQQQQQLQQHQCRSQYAEHQLGSPQDCGQAMPKILDSWDCNSWLMLSPDARGLLQGLYAAENIPWEMVQRWGSALKRKVNDICTGHASGNIAPSDACRGYALYAASVLLQRLHGGPHASVVYAQVGRMYDSAKDYVKAAHYYKMNIVANEGRAELPPGKSGGGSALRCIASAYDWHSHLTGELSSYQRAFAWQAVLVKHLMHEPDQEQLLNKQCLLLAEMLSTQAKHTPGLPEESRIELAIGAFLCSLRGTQQGPEVGVWLEQHVKVIQTAQQTYKIFLATSWQSFEQQNCNFQHQATARPVQALSNTNSSSSKNAPSITTVVSLSDESDPAKTHQMPTSAELQTDKSSRSPAVADVKATVSNHCNGRNMRQGHVVWKIPYVVTEAQAAVLRKVATLAFRLDRHKEVELSLRVAVP